MAAPVETNETLCGGCGKPVDTLRAGSVAILAGRFRYYCDHDCKTTHLLAMTGSILSDDVATAEPPPVSFIDAREVAGDVDEEDAHAEAHGEGPESNTEAPPEEEPVHAAESAGDLDRAPADRDAAPADASEPSPDPEPEESPPPQSPRIARPNEVGAAESPRFEAARASEWVAIGGLVVGALATAVGLAGMEAARLPLAVVAAFAVFARSALRAREPADVHAALTVAPLLGLLSVAGWTASNGDARANAAALLLGISSACVLAVDLIVARARKGVEASRAHIARELDVKVHVLRGEQTEEIDAALVKPGERVVIEEGATVGADGVVVAGEAAVVPFLDAPTETTKREGDTIVAGARVVSGRLHIVVTWGANERAWAKLALSPELRIDVTAPIAKAARLVALRGAPIAAALAGVAAYVTNGSASDVVMTACVVALACGATGVAAVVGLAHAEGHAKALARGIVYKDAAGFDRAGRTDVAVVCSRGTVLMGEPEIVALEGLAGIDDGRLIALAAGAETASTHPFASAILRGARERGERPENVRNAMVHAGLGVTALAASGERLVVGSRALLMQEKVSVAAADARVSELEAQGRSVLLVALGGRLAGLLALQDGLRPGARAAVQRLLDARIEPVLLSGEARETCETIGRALDIDHIRPEVLPADRGAEIRALSEGGHVVAVLGHPASDDGALGAADVSIAMSAAGSTPGEWAVQLASDDVRDAALALRISRTARDGARRALIGGLVPSAAAILAVTFGVAPMALAPLAAFVGTLVAARVR